MSEKDAKRRLMEGIGEVDDTYYQEAEYTEKELEKIKAYQKGSGGAVTPIQVKEELRGVFASASVDGDMNAPIEDIDGDLLLQKDRKIVPIFGMVLGVALTAAAILLFVFLWNPDRSDVVTTTDGSEIEETTSSDETTETDDVVVAKPVRIDEEHFPDEVFRHYIIGYFDRDLDGTLSIEEIEGATEIWVEHGEINDTVFGKSFDGFSETIHDLAGIEYLTSLQLLACSGNDLKTLDISRNPELTALDCSNNKLSELDVSHNPKLSQLICSYNSLTQLDVSHNPEFSYLRVESEVTVLDAGQTFRRVNPAAKVAKPVIIDQSWIGQAAPNEMLTLFVTAAGEGELSYQWQYNTSDSTPWSDFEQGDAKSPTFSIEMKDEIDDLRIRCKVRCDDSLPVYSNTTILEMIIPVTPAYFPDDTFRDYVSSHLDVDDDGILRRFERDVSDIDVSNMSIRSLKGIEYLAISSLNCSHNQLMNLDMSANRNLRTLYCSDNQLTEIDLSGKHFYDLIVHVDPEVNIIWDLENDILFSEVIWRYDAFDMIEGWYVSIPPMGETTGFDDPAYFDYSFATFKSARVANAILCLEGNLFDCGSLISFAPFDTSDATDSPEYIDDSEATDSMEEYDPHRLFHCYGYDDVRLPLAPDVKLTLQTYYSGRYAVEKDQKEYDISQFEEILSDAEQKAISYNETSSYEIASCAYLVIHYTGEVVDEIIIYAEYYDYPPREEDIE